jgi:hypothetical protein
LVVYKRFLLDTKKRATEAVRLILWIDNKRKERKKEIFIALIGHNNDEIQIIHTTHALSLTE